VGSRCGCGGVPGGWGVPGCWAKSADNRPILKYFLNPGTLGSVPLLPSIGKDRASHWDGVLCDFGRDRLGGRHAVLPMPEAC
jgi:hypothetical protein